MSETVSAKHRITQIIAQWVPGSWAGNSKCQPPLPHLLCFDNAHSRCCYGWPQKFVHTTIKQTTY